MVGNYECRRAYFRNTTTDVSRHRPFLSPPIAHAPNDRPLALDNVEVAHSHRFRRICRLQIKGRSIGRRLRELQPKEVSQNDSALARCPRHYADSKEPIRQRYCKDVALGVAGFLTDPCQTPSPDFLRRLATAAFGGPSRLRKSKRPRLAFIGAQRSPTRANLSRTLSSRKSSISTPVSTSSHVTGVETVARGFARTE